MMHGLFMIMRMTHITHRLLSVMLRCLTRCPSRQCLEVHARSGMLVDTSAVHEILMDSLPEIGRNATVAQLRKPFPKGAVSGAQTGFWSDK